MNNISGYLPYIEVYLDNLIHNISEIRKKIPRSKGIMAVVKDMAYGCGCVPISKTFQENNIEFLAVAFAKEAFFLRKNNINLPILVFSSGEKNDWELGFNQNIIFSLNDLTDAILWQQSSLPIKFHINVDTGMGRLGILPSEISVIIEIIKNNPNLICDGIYTHLACADIPSTNTVDIQLKKFKQVIEILRQNGINPSQIHYANSAGIMRFPLDNECTLVRPGISLYGCNPDPNQDFGIKLKSVIGLKARIIKIKQVSANTPISYCSRYITSSDTNIATIPLGYSAGLPRHLTNKGCVLIKGRRYKIAGTVTMDYIMVDIGKKTDLKIGDEVVAIGYQGNEYIGPDEVASNCNTIAYEILCGLGKHLDRYFIKENQIILHQEGYFF
jgi:alanine racemase